MLLAAARARELRRRRPGGWPRGRHGHARGGAAGGAGGDGRPGGPAPGAPRARRLLPGARVPHLAARRPAAPVRRRAGRAGDDPARRPQARHAVPRHRLARDRGRGAGAVVARVRARLRAEPAVLRLLHRRAGRPAGGRVPGPRRRARRRRIGPPRAADARRRGQPQRRPAPLRPRPPALYRHRRRRRRRRPAREPRQRPGPGLAAGQDPADRPAGGERARVLGSVVEPVHRPLRRARRDLQLRAAQPVAVLVRPPDRGPLDRRRRAERPRGDQLGPPRPRARGELRLAPVRGPRALRAGRAGAGPRAARDRPLARATATARSPAASSSATPGSTCPGATCSATSAAG